jgi:hypothetical protein
MEGPLLEFLKSAKSQSIVRKRPSSNPDYQALNRDYDQRQQSAAPRIREINERLRELGAQILAVQNTFTDRRA